MRVKKFYKVRVVNSIIWAVLLGLLTKDGFFSPDTGTFSQGQVRGVAIFIALFLVVIYPALTVYYTLRSGNKGKLAENLKHNYLALISFSWKDK